MDNVVMKKGQTVAFPLEGMKCPLNVVKECVVKFPRERMFVAMITLLIPVVYLLEVLLLREVLSRVVLEVVVIIQNSVMHQRG